MILQYIKNWWNKPKSVPSQSATRYSSLRIHGNSRITIDNSMFLIHDQYLIMPNPGTTFIVKALRSFGGYGIQAFDCIVQSTSNKLTYILRIEQDEHTQELCSITLLHAIDIQHPQTAADWSNAHQAIKSDQYRIANDTNQLQYDSEEPNAATYSYDAKHLVFATGVSFTESSVGKVYSREVCNKLSTIKELLVVEHMDSSWVFNYVGIEVNPAGLTII